MKLALIPPLSQMETIVYTDYHLALPELLTNDYYSSVMTEQAKSGAYVILDNGAAEGVLTTDEDLLRCAASIRANEIVVPDVLSDMHETLRAIRHFAQYANMPEGQQFKYMAVVQGESLYEGTTMLDILRDEEFNWIDTIGIPRRWLDLNQGHTRMTLAAYSYRVMPEKEIHLLGTHPLFPDEVLRANVSMKFIRGIDTSMPFNYAYNRVEIDQGYRLPRPPNYFSLQFDADQIHHMWRNIEILQTWTR